ncbi:exo-alpha-sialidase [Blastopirellula marina]|nr:exo-alpha-sialidase [Blastopirellula marina]
MTYRVSSYPLCFVVAICWTTFAFPSLSAAQESAESPVMLAGDWVPPNPHDIDFAKLPKVPSQHVVISDVRKRNGVHQHNYLTFYDGRYWAMWSDGPGIEDQGGQRVSYSTSADGLTWAEPQFLTPIPRDSGPESPYYGTRSPKGFRWIARGFWQREGELLALASLDESAGFFGPSLQLRAFRWNQAANDWEDAGLLQENAINNFPPQKIGTGQWMMSRRTHDYKKVGVQFMLGGVDRLDQWTSAPVLGSADDLSAEEPCWWTLPDGRLAALFRDNRRSGYLYRSFSSDDGRSWSRPVRTDFPDARSKFCCIRLKDGRYVLVSNPHPQKRDPLAISISDDGVVFTKMGYLIGGRHVDYPHLIEQDGSILVAFAGGKQTVEVLKIKLEDLNALQMPDKPLVK